MKLLSLSFFFLILLSFHASAQTSAPTSEIPARRDFPVNTEINPCTDFYEYACSKVKSTFKLRDDRSYHAFAFHDSSERILEAKKAYLKGLTRKKNLSKRSTSLSRVYSACMNEAASKKEEKEIVPSLLRKVNGLKNLEQFQLFLIEQMRKGEDFSIISLGTIPNQTSPEKNDLYFLSDLLNLPERTYYDKDETVLDLVQLAKAFFDELHEPNAQSRAESIVQFQKDAAKTSLLPVELRDRISIPTGITKTEFLKKWPHLRFDKFFSEVPDNTHIRNLSPENFDWINQSFEKVPLLVLKDAYLFRALSPYMDDAYPGYFAKLFEFNKKHLGGPDVRPMREERCTRFVMERLGMELDAELLPVLFPHFPTEKVTAIAEKVRESIITSIKTNTWLSEKAKEMAVAKMQVAKLQLVKPSEEADWNFALPASYDAHKPYFNQRLLSRNALKKELIQLKKPRNENRWEMSPLTVNAYYSPSDNQFVLPIGILQYPFFDGQLSAEANFGSMGSVVGHELGHGIDDKGAKYDAKGKLFQWMTEKDLEEFTQKGKKIKTQLDDLGFPGGLKLGEFIGDLTGVSLSYHAALPPQTQEVEKKKAFFTQFARTWCYVARPKWMEMMAKTNPHPPGEVRTNEVLKHVDAFQETYQCKKGDRMYLAPKDRIKIW